jgi:hypothetical protein
MSGTRFWTDAEVAQLVTLVDKYGDQWKLVAREMPGRSDHACYDKYLALTAKKPPRQTYPKKAKREEVIIPQNSEGTDLNWEGFSFN